MAIILRKTRQLWKPPLGARINSSHPLAQGLIGAWLMNEGGGATAYDISGKNNNGAINGPTWTASKLGRGLSFNGTSAYIQVSTSGLVTGVNWTILAYVIIPSGTTAPSGGRSIYAERASSGNDIVKLDCMGFAYTHQADVVIRNDSGTLLFVHGVKAIDDGNPHLIVATKAGTAITLYIDGKVDNTGVWAGADTYTNAIQTRIGGDAGDPSALFSGSISFVESFKGIALSAAEVQQLYAQPFCFMQPRRVFMPEGASASTKIYGFASCGGIQGTGIIGVAS